MKPYIIVPIEWIEKEIALNGERIIEYGDGEYYMARIMLLYKLMEQFAILNEEYETRKQRDDTRRKSDSAKLHIESTAKRKLRHRSTRNENKKTPRSR